MIEVTASTRLTSAGLLVARIGALLAAGWWVGLKVMGSQSGSGASLPFIWTATDIACIWFVCGLPCAALLSNGIARRLSPWLCFVTGAFVAAALWLAVGRLSPVEATDLAGGWRGDLWRGAVSVLAGASSLLMLGAHPEIDRAASEYGLGRTRKFSLAFALVILCLPPLVYTEARLRQRADDVAELLDQSRYGEAQRLIAQILELKPDAEVRGKPLREIAPVVNDVVREIELRVNDQLPADAGDRELLDRSTDLAMLGRTAEALAVLAALDNPNEPEACLLEATIHETRSSWPAARDAYRQARQALLAGSSDQVALVRAIRGVAFSERKLGALPAAEEAYLELLSLSPTADSQFLVAQFYEDVQRTDRARHHVRLAMAASPQYAEPGRKLLDRMATRHFGCLGK